MLHIIDRLKRDEVKGRITNTSDKERHQSATTPKHHSFS